MELENKKKTAMLAGCVIAAVLVLFFGFEIITQKIAVNNGVDYLADNKYEKAYNSFLKAEKKHTILTSKKNIRYYEGECLIYLGRYKEAAEIYEKIADKREEARAYALEGFAFQQNGNQKKAVENYEKAISADKKDGIGYYYLYGYYIENEQYDDALAILEDAQDVPVTSMEQEIAYAKVVVFEKMLEYDKALDAAKSYCKTYPDDENGKREKEFLETR
ncbi:MAG: hypothetical protein Q4E73_02465 [Lachnospiraceae bacterium]|nr:hypothetical protein [Lachnospiraceae bacterium]